MRQGLRAAANALREALCAFEPALYSGADCAVLVEELAATEKACAAARVRAAARATDCGAHREKGFADAADWLARSAGTSTVEAKNAMATTRALEAMPATAAALAAGELSLAQAQEIATTEVERPGSEAELLEVAKGQSLKALKETARKKRLESIDPEALHRKQRGWAREFRTWRDDLGMVRFGGGLPPEIGVPFANRIDAEADRLRRAAKAEGRNEPWEAHAADALVKLLEGGGKGKANAADLVLVCDVRAYRRGHTHPGEPCHIVGGGPLPVCVVRELAQDAFVKAVLHDGVAIHTVVHFGRHIPAELRTALELGHPPDFDGVTCVEEGCDRRYRLEWDHDDPLANGGPTSYDNMRGRCWPHHRDKTERDRKAGLLGGGRDERGPP